MRFDTTSGAADDPRSVERALRAAATNAAQHKE
jgi:hypothetical protein